MLGAEYASWAHFMQEAHIYYDDHGITFDAILLCILWRRIHHHGISTIYCARHHCQYIRASANWAKLLALCHCYTQLQPKGMQWPMILGEKCCHTNSSKSLNCRQRQEEAKWDGSRLHHALLHDYEVPGIPGFSRGLKPWTQTSSKSKIMSTKGNMFVWQWCNSWLSPSFMEQLTRNIFETVLLAITPIGDYSIFPSQPQSIFCMEALTRHLQYHC